MVLKFSRNFMYFYRFFVLLTLSSLLITSNVECGRKNKEKSQNPGSLSGSSQASGHTSSQQPDESNSQSQSPTPVAESALDLNDLRDEHGIIKEVTIDNWKFKFYRSYINQNFNKLKKGSLDLWPQAVSESCIFDFILVFKDNKHFLCLKSINPDGNTGMSHVYFEEDSSNSSNSKKEELQSQDFFKRFKDNLHTVLIEPYPADLVKHPLFQKLHYDKNNNDQSQMNQVKVI